MKRMLSIVMAVAILICGVNGVWEEKIKAKTSLNINESKLVSGFTKKNIKKEDKEENYIVVAKSHKIINQLKKNYEAVERSHNEDLLAANENMITLSLTGCEANALQDQKGMLLVEKDLEMKACSQEKKKRVVRKKSKNNRKKGEWNLQSIRVDTSDKKSNTFQNRVKIAVLDSGIDYDNDIEITESINLIPGEEEMSPLFTDDTGHGTSVAGIIAAQDNKEGITGINENVELYSARVLCDDIAPVSRVVQAIYWAIEKQVNIINISFSMSEDSQLLRKAITDAYDAGILIIAAAGNNGRIEYPAAYDEVMAVGSVDYEGNRSAASACGDGLELVAPGEKVKCSALLGGTVTATGTSLSAPHVTGVASLLWEKDLSVSHKFIRSLLNESANRYGDKNEYGNGLVDYQYAMEIYSEYKKKSEINHSFMEKDNVNVATAESVAIEIPENNTPLVVFDENNYVEGRWAGHDGTVAEYTTVKNFQYGAKAPDSLENLKGLNANHAWHGGRFCNFVANYRYLNKVARAVNDLGESASLDSIKAKIRSVGKVSGMDTFEYGNLHADSQTKYADGVYEGMKRDLCTYVAPILKGKTKRQKEAYVFGLASHVATDAYSHASYRYNGYKWNYIKHEKDDKGNFNTEHPLYADRVKCVPRRFNSAKAVLKNIVSRFDNERSNINIIHDFAIDSAWTEGTRRKYYNTYMIKFTVNAQYADATYRLYHFGDYMLTAGESNGQMLSMYSLASEYPGNIYK